MIKNDKRARRYRAPSQSDLRTYMRLLSYLKGSVAVFAVVVLCMILEAAFQAASFGLAKPLIDLAMNKPVISAKAQAVPSAGSSAKSDDPLAGVDALKEQLRARYEPKLIAVQTRALKDSDYKYQVLQWLIAAMLGFGALMVAAAFCVGYLSSYLATKAVQKLRNHVFSHMVRLDMAYFSTSSTGTMMSLVIQDVQAVDGALDVIFNSVIKNPIKIIFFVTLMVMISPELTMISFVVLPIIGGTIFLLGKRVRRVSQKVQKTRAELSSLLEEAFTGMRVIKGYNMEGIEAKRFDKKSRDIFRMSLKTKSAEEFGGGLTQFLGLATVAIVVLVGTYFVFVLRKLDGSSFVLFSIFLTQVFRPMKGWSKVTSRIQKGLAGCDRVFSVLDLKPSITDKRDAIALEPLRQKIEFQNVSFTYARSREPALREITLTIPAGKAVALVGETGSGKSTLANLLPRFYDPEEGAIFYDGIDLRDVQLESLRGQMAIVTQEVVLFDDTVANNIAYGLQYEVSFERIESAAKAAKAHDFILRLPQGYDTMVGSRGGRLSGGERQRLAIARAILKDAPILIMDEATSALDSETEALIQEALANLIQGRTVIVIAHRLSTIQNCDHIYVLDKGRIIEQGTHAELLKREGRYARFHQIQFALPATG